MHTRVIRVDPHDPDSAAIAEAAATLTRGGLVAFPTETVYGLGANALSEAAVGGIYRAKGRPPTDPMIVHIAHVDQLPGIADEVPPIVADLARRFWPGPLTLILPKRASVPDVVSAGLPTIGVRIPSHTVSRRLLSQLALPVAAPSANRFSHPSPTTAEHVLHDLDGLIDLVIDGGPTSIGIESTILDLTVSPPLVRRPGRASLDDIREILPDVQSVTATLGTRYPQPAPGQLLRHYAPRARLTLYVGSVDCVSQRVAADARASVAAGSRVGILAPEEDLLALAPRLAAVAARGRILSKRYGSRRNQDEAAHDLFRALREIDEDDVDVILALAPGAQGIGIAVIDRLTRAADGRVVYLQE